jgi:ribose transport system ATP-binding protein
MTTPRLEMRAISKAFGGVTVLREVSLTVQPAEVVALLGANGAGKSTLVKIISGIHPSDGGSIRVDGRPAALADPQEAVAAGIRLIPQEISVHPDLSVAENVCMGALPTRRVLGITTVDRAAMRARTQALLARLGHAHDPERRVGSLGLSQQRVVEIARALAGDARLLIMDEPTAALAEAECETLFAVVEALRREGVSIIYISHYLDEVFRLSDRIVVLRDGVVSGEFRPAQATHDQVLGAMLGTVSGDLFPAKPVRGPAPPLLDVAGLNLPQALEDVSLTVQPGEILGVFGLLGSGVEHIGRAIFGAETQATWRAATLGGAPLPQGDPRASVRAGVGFLAAERKREGLIGIMTVRDNTTLPFLDRFVRAGLLDVAAETGQTKRWIDALHVRTKGPEQEIRLLSGGNQQKICLARWLVGDIRLLILEEPTRGVDLGARREIYALIRDLAARGLAVLAISTDAEEVAGLADRTLVLRGGRIAASLGPAAQAADLLAAASQMTDRTQEAA